MMQETYLRGYTLKTIYFIGLRQVGRLHTFLSDWAKTILLFMKSGGYYEIDLPKNKPILLIYGENDQILPRKLFIQLESALQSIPGF